MWRNNSKEEREKSNRVIWNFKIFNIKNRYNTKKFLNE